MKLDSLLLLIRIQLKIVRSRILAYWGIYFTIAMVIFITWSQSIPNSQKMIASFLQFNLVDNALNLVLMSPLYPTYFSLLPYIMGPVILLILVDMIPTELMTGQLTVLKSSVSSLQRTYLIRYFLILVGFMLPHMIFWGLIHLINILVLGLEPQIFFDAIIFSIFHYVFFTLIIFLFFSFCVLITFVFSFFFENQVLTSFLGIFLLILPEICQSLLSGIGSDLLVSPTAILSHLFYLGASILKPMTITDQNAILGVIIFAIIILVFFGLFNRLLCNKDVY